MGDIVLDGLFVFEKAWPKCYKTKNWQDK